MITETPDGMKQITMGMSNLGIFLNQQKSSEPEVLTSFTGTWEQPTDQGQSQQYYDEGMNTYYSRTGPVPNRLSQALRVPVITRPS